MAAHHTSSTNFISILTLAWQRARQAWRMLLVTGVGMVRAVMVVCAVPMYSRVALAAGLRSTFGTYAQNGEIVVRSLPRLISTELVSQATQHLNNTFDHALGPYLAPPQFSIQTPRYTIFKKDRRGMLQLASIPPEMMFIGSQLDQAGPHVQMMQGRLPRVTSGDEREVAVKPDTASWLHLAVGATLYLSVSLFDGAQTHLSRVVPLPIVGIFTPRVGDPFWHGEDFAIASDGYSTLASNTAIISAPNSISQNAAAHHKVFTAAPNILWYYRPDTSRITIDDLDALIQGVNTAEIAVSKDPFLEQIPYLQYTQAYVPYDVLNQFRGQVSIAQVPVNCFLALILGLALFFVSSIAGLLVDRQSDALAILRSREAMLRAGIYALAAAATVLLATIFALWRARNRDAQAQRLEAARSTDHPLGQRLHLDSLAIVLALAGGGAVLYLNTTVSLTTQLRLLLVALLTLVASLCLLLASLLLVMRFCLQLLRSGARIAPRSRGATPLLSLAGSLAISSLIYSASEAQHVQEVADFRAGADFSGTIPVALYPASQLDSAIAAYRSIPGVITATPGCTAQATAGLAGEHPLSSPVDFKAVNASTFAQTALRSTQDSQQPLASLMQLLIASRGSSLGKETVPANIDVNAANALHLSSGAPFILNFGLLNTTPDHFSVAAIVQQIPTPGDSSVPGILADYRTFVGVYTRNFTTVSDFAIPLNYAWLRTRDEGASLANVRKALNTLPTIQEIQQGALSSQADLRLDPLYDRRTMLTDLEHKPLTGVLLLGATTALLLAALGILIASPLHIVFPPSLGVVLDTLGMICLLALAMMVYGASRPSMQQVLRLNED